MPVITVSAVDTANDKLTATAHGLTTGDRFRLRNVGGALPAATPALAQATDYFANRVDADNIKVYDTNAHALAGGATGLFDLTGSGSGTTTVEYGLPYCVPTASAAVGTQIKSANDNGAWAALVALYCLLVGLAQSIWTGITLASGQHITLQGAGLYKRPARIRHMQGCAGILTTAPAGGVSYYVADLFAFRANTDVARWTPVLEEGEQLQSVTAYVSCGPTDVITLKVYKSTQVVGSAAVQTGTQLGSTQTSSGHTAVIEALTVSGLTENVGTGLQGYHFELACTAFATGPRVALILYTTAIV